jgi:tRNA (mo5U34)-methyltransferase
MEGLMEYSREYVLSRIAELDEAPGWYQNIDLKNGIHTKTRKVWGEELDHPRRRWEAVRSAFPESLAGKSVLDVGCNAGFFSFMAAERGAESVLGVDYNDRYVEQARFCNAVRGDKVEFRVMPVGDVRKLGRSFDITLCIGLLYHVHDILGAIQAISDVTTEMAIVESAIHPNTSDVPLLLYTGNDKKLPGHWHPNMSALSAMLLAVGFQRVEPTFRDGGRGGIVAFKT